LIVLAGMLYLLLRPAHNNKKELRHSDRNVNAVV